LAYGKRAVPIVCRSIIAAGERRAAHHISAKNTCMPQAHAGDRRGETSVVESQPHPASRESPPQDNADDARLMFQRAERAWREQVAGEEITPQTPVRVVFRWLLLAVSIAAILFLLFERLGQLG
jgi:hypothetical protein